MFDWIKIQLDRCIFSFIVWKDTPETEITISVESHHSLSS